MNLLPQLQTAFEKRDFHHGPEGFLSAGSPSDLTAFSYTETGISTPRPRRIPTFPRFSKLPAELRLQIWKYAQPEDRYFTINFVKIFDIKIVTKSWSISCSQRSPALLFVCQESRKETLLDYLPIRSRSFEGEETRTLYFNAKIDVVYISFAQDAPETVTAFVDQGIKVRKLGIHQSERLQLRHRLENGQYICSMPYWDGLSFALPKCIELEELQIEGEEETAWRQTLVGEAGGVMGFVDHRRYLPGLISFDYRLSCVFKRLKVNENWKRPKVRFGRFVTLQ
jgi:hypothetical protein